MTKKQIKEIEELFNLKQVKEKYHYVFSETGNISIETRINLCIDKDDLSIKYCHNYNLEAIPIPLNKLIKLAKILEDKDV